VVFEAMLSALTVAIAGAQGAAKQAPRFEVDPMWPKPMPNRWILGSAVGVAVDARDHVFVVHRQDSFNARTEMGSGTNPPTGECCTPAPSVLEFDADGNLVGHWGGPGDGYEWPATPSGIAIDPKGNVWIAGSGGTDAHLLQFSRDGKFLKQIAKAGKAPPPPPRPANDTAYAGVSGRGGRGGRGGPPPYNMPPNSSATDAFGGAARIAFDATGTEAYVADGYRNRRVAVLDLATGNVKKFWGAYGKAPVDAATAAYSPDGPASQQFGTPVMCAVPSKDGLVYVCDKTNDRIQVFKKDGSFVKEAKIAPKTLGEGSVWDIAFSRDPQQRYLYVADGMNDKVWIVDRQSLETIASFGDGGRQPGQFYAVHSVATDSKGNLYTVETYEGKRVQKFNYKGLGAAQHRATVWPTSGGTR
jgi:DNA-binding beta-propeller fold protein YncE